jgi:sugar O-acyltransferase (sialic acid O-acetyltransferase NeuD family)
MKYREHFIFGAGGHGRVIAELLQFNDCKVEAFFDDSPKLNLINSIPIISSNFIEGNEIKLQIIIAVGDNLTRKSISQRLSHNAFYSCFHKNATISPSSKIDNGTVVMQNAIINSNVEIGKHVIINTATIVEHDCVIEDYAHISPNATLLGNVTVGEGTQIGAGVIALPGIKIGKWCVIGAGSVLLNNIPDGSIVVGNPGRIIKQNPLYHKAKEFEGEAIAFE